MFFITSTFIIWYWIIVGIIALVVALIHAGIDNMGSFDIDDFFDSFFGESGWVFTLIALAIGGLVFAFIVWIWWILLLIIVGILAIVGIIALCVYLYDEHEYVKRTVSSDTNQEDELENKVEKFVVEPDDEGIRFSDIVGLNEAKEAIKEKVIYPFEHPQIFARFGKKTGGILLYGLSGTGKTMFAKAIANELNALFLLINCSNNIFKLKDNSNRVINEIFDKAKDAKRAVIFFDDFEVISSSKVDDSGYNYDVLTPEILTEMQSIKNNEENIVIVIIATNKPWEIDRAFLKTGKFSEKIYIPLPDYEIRKTIFESQLKILPVADDLSYDYLAKITDGFNYNDIEDVCEKLKMSAINDSLADGCEKTIGMDDVANIESSIKSSISKTDIEAMEKFNELNKQ